MPTTEKVLALTPVCGRSSGISQRLEQTKDILSDWVQVNVVEARPCR